MDADRSGKSLAFNLLVALATLVLAGCVSAHAQSPNSPPDNRFGELDSYIEKTMSEWRVPGVALAIVDREGVVHAKGFGTLDINTGAPVTPETIFAVGSNGKSLTATMLGALQDEGKLDLSARIVTMLPDFRMANPDNTDAVKLEDALSHVSGLPTQSGLGAWYLLGADQKALVESIRRVTPLTPVGSRFAYNNSMFAVAAEAAEAETGEDYHELMASRIFAPLGMARSSTSLDRFPDGNVAKPHAYIGGKPVRIPFHPVIGAAAAGSVNASLMDMTRFVRMMMGGGSLDGKTIVSGQTARRIQSTRHELAESEMPEIFQILRSVQYPDEVGPVGYGLGLANVEYFGATYPFHGGSIDGMTSWMMWSPERDIGVVVLTNSGNIAYPAWAAFAAVNAGAGLPADTTLVRLAGLRDQILADPPHPEPASGVPPIVPLSELYGDYANRLGAFSIRPGDNGKATLTFPETGFVADVTPLGGRDYWVDLRNPALPDFGLTLTSQPGDDKAILAESPSELPPLFASDPAFVRHSR